MEFWVHFDCRGGWGDTYSCYLWNKDLEHYELVFQEIFYGTKKEIVDMIKRKVYDRFGIKRAKWEFN